VRFLLQDTKDTDPKPNAVFLHFISDLLFSLLILKLKKNIPFFFFFIFHTFSKKNIFLKNMPLQENPRFDKNIKNEEETIGDVDDCLQVDEEGKVDMFSQTNVQQWSDKLVKVWKIREIVYSFCLFTINKCHTNYITAC
jgi:hypothetical protein